VLLVWQDRDRNEWSSAIFQALAASSAAPTPPSGGQHAFSLADPANVEGILAASRFAEVGFTDVHEPVYYGRDSATAYDFVRGLRDTKDLLAELDGAQARARAPTATRDPRRARHRQRLVLRFARLDHHRPPPLTRHTAAHLRR
jgi:hypothetical protein